MKKTLVTTLQILCLAAVLCGFGLSASASLAKCPDDCNPSTHACCKDVGGVVWYGVYGG